MWKNEIIALYLENGSEMWKDEENEIDECREWWE
jgi:hypothetical protein